MAYSSLNNWDGHLSPPKLAHYDRQIQLKADTMNQPGGHSIRTQQHGSGTITSQQVEQVDGWTVLTDNEMTSPVMVSPVAASVAKASTSSTIMVSQPSTPARPNHSSPKSRGSLDCLEMSPTIAARKRKRLDEGTSDLEPVTNFKHRGQAEYRKPTSASPSQAKREKLSSTSGTNAACAISIASAMNAAMQSNAALMPEQTHSRKPNSVKTPLRVNTTNKRSPNVSRSNHASPMRRDSANRETIHSAKHNGASIVNSTALAGSQDVSIISVTASLGDTSASPPQIASSLTDSARLPPPPRYETPPLIFHSSPPKSVVKLDSEDSALTSLSDDEEHVREDEDEEDELCDSLFTPPISPKSKPPDSPAIPLDSPKRKKPTGTKSRTAAQEKVPAKSKGKAKATWKPRLEVTVEVPRVKDVWGKGIVYTSSSTGNPLHRRPMSKEVFYPRFAQVTQDWSAERKRWEEEEWEESKRRYQKSTTPSHASNSQRESAVLGKRVRDDEDRDPHPKERKPRKDKGVSKVPTGKGKSKAKEREEVEFEVVPCAGFGKCSPLLVWDEDNDEKEDDYWSMWFVGYGQRKARDEAEKRYIEEEKEYNDRENCVVETEDEEDEQEQKEEEQGDDDDEGEELETVAMQDDDESSIGLDDIVPLRDEMDVEGDDTEDTVEKHLGSMTSNLEALKDIPPGSGGVGTINPMILLPTVKLVDYSSSDSESESDHEEEVNKATSRDSPERRSPSPIPSRFSTPSTLTESARSVSPDPLPEIIRTPSPALPESPRSPSVVATPPAPPAMGPPWPTGPVEAFCHMCRNRSYRLSTRCSVCPNKHFCVRCLSTRFPAGIPFTFKAGEKIHPCPFCGGYCTCDQCSRKRGEVYQSIRPTPRGPKKEPKVNMVKRKPLPPRDYVPNPDGYIPPSRLGGKTNLPALRERISHQLQEKDLAYWGPLYTPFGARIGAGWIEVDRPRATIHYDSDATSVSASTATLVDGDLSSSKAGSSTEFESPHSRECSGPPITVEAHSDISLSSSELITDNESSCAMITTEASTSEVPSSEPTTERAVASLENDTLMTSTPHEEQWPTVRIHMQRSRVFIGKMQKEWGVGRDGRHRAWQTHTWKDQDEEWETLRPENEDDNFGFGEPEGKVIEEGKGIEERKGKGKKTFIGRGDVLGWGWKVTAESGKEVAKKEENEAMVPSLDAAVLDTAVSPSLMTPEDLDAPTASSSATPTMNLDPPQTSSSTSKDILDTAASIIEGDGLIFDSSLLALDASVS